MTPWHASPTAAAILATLAANPPAKRTARYAFGESAEVYTDQNGDGTLREGRPVRTLNKLYREHGEKLGASCGDDFKRWALDSPDAAIDRAIAEAARLEREAAGRRRAA